MKGKLYVIGLGPGNVENMTLRAYNCIKQCEVLVGYSIYIEQIEELIRDKEIIKRSMGQEVERCKIAIAKASEGKIVGVVCSGDAGLYGMAGLILQLCNKEQCNEKLDVEIISGVTSALSCSSLLGAPIVEDFCTISLSDYMVSWDKILNRIEKACEADFVISLYNPKSNARPDYLQKAIDLIRKYRSDDTPIGIVRKAFRQSQNVTVTSLDKIDFDTVDMFCTIIIGNSNSVVINDKIVTLRGYSL